MAIDISKMRNKLDALKGGGKAQNAKFWSPQEGVQTIRILPTSDGDPFKSYFFHYGFGKESILCPKGNFGDPCPICDFAAKLYNDKDEESRELASRIVKKQRFFSPVLVRGEEKDGNKIWGYGKTVYQDLINLVLNPDYGDITDPDNGTDLSIKADKVPGASFPTTKLTPARKTSKLCNGTPQECSELLETVPDFNEIHEVKTSEEIARILDEHLTAADDADVEAESKQTSKYGGATQAKKKATDDVDAAFRDLLA